MRYIFLGIFALLLSALPSYAQDTSSCGPPPSEDVLKDVSSRTKTEIEGKAQAISKLVGSADLGGAIEIQRRSLYQTSDKSEAIRYDRYLAYVTCLLIMKDTSSPLKDKVDAIQKLRQPISSPSDKSGAVRKFLNTVEKDTTPAKITEVLGAPDAQKTFDLKVKKKKRTYSFARYERDDVTLYIITSNGIRGVALHLPEAAPATARFPIPNFPVEPGEEHEMGGITLGFLKEECDDSLSKPDVRFLYVIIRSCSYGNAGSGSFFVFGFDGGASVEKDNDPTAIDRLGGKTLSSVQTPGFYDTRINFALVHFYAPNDEGGYTAEAIAAVILRDIYWRHTN